MEIFLSSIIDNIEYQPYENKGAPTNVINISKYFSMIVHLNIHIFKRQSEYFSQKQPYPGK